jgi:hypothetical protein
MANPVEPALDGGDDSSTGALVPRWLVGCIGVKLIFGFFVLLYLLADFWPAKAAGTSVWATQLSLFFWCAKPECPWQFSLDPEIRFIFLIAITAAMGSYVQVATSFTTYLGNNRLRLRWLWWYFLRVPIGIALAELFYFAVRGGFFASGANSGDINPFGVAALGGLVGMFSKQAADKLLEVFESAFESKADAQRGDKMKNPVPRIDGTEPVTLTPQSPLKLMLLGAGFIAESAVTMNGEKRDAQLLDAQRLLIVLKPQDVLGRAALVVVVTNPGPGGGTARYPLPS